MLKLYTVHVTHKIRRPFLPVTFNSFKMKMFNTFSFLLTDPTPEMFIM